MKTRFLALEFLNKCQIVVPFILLLGCDGSAGDESLIAGGATLILIFSLTILEVYYRNASNLLSALKLSSTSALLTVIVSALELDLFVNIHTFNGSIAIYGIPNTLLVLSLILFVFAWLFAWVDIHAHSKGISQNKANPTRQP